MSKHYTAKEVGILLQKAEIHFQGRRIAEAELLTRRILEDDPGQPDANHLQGLISFQLGQYELAEMLIRQAIKSRPADSGFHYNYGFILGSMGRHEEALVAYKKAIEVNPDFSEAYNNCGATLVKLGRFDEAVTACERAAELNPQNAGAHNTRGHALSEVGRMEEALVACELAIKINPNLAEAHYNLGNILKGMLRLEESLIAYDHAILLSPTFAEAFHNRGSVLREIGSFDAAENDYRRALDLKPDDAQAHSNFLFLLASGTKLSPGELLDEQRRWDKIHGRKGRMYPLPDRARETSSGRRLRIGYVSSDFRNHAVSYFFEPLLISHDRRHFEIFCYASVNSWRADEFTKRLQSHAEHWRCVADENDEELAKLIRDDSIDILIDLGGHTAGNRLKAFTYRPAPVQATYLGFFAATGLEAMDYWITDEVFHPLDTPERTVEEIYRLPRCSLCYQPPAHTNLVLPRRGTDENVVFGSFNDLSKLSSEVIETWSQLMIKLPGSHLLISTKNLGDPGIRRLLLERFAQFGIPAERLLLHSTPLYEEWIAGYSKVDIVLDPFPRTGCTTTAEALWMGVPVVTLAGQRYAGRASASVLQAVGLENLITHDREEYINKAMSLARDPVLRDNLRSRLRERMTQSPLCDGEGLARALESAYLNMWALRNGPV